MTRPTYSAAAEAEIRRRWREQGEALCTECGVPMTGEVVPVPRDVSYVRRRSWLTCPRCRRSVVADDPREQR